MRRTTAALAAALLLANLLFPAARALAQAASPFPVVPIPSGQKQSHVGAYLTLLTGAGLVGASYVLADRANDRYAEYLSATDPGEITRLYDETVTLDRLSSGSLLTGEVLIATGLYLRFLRKPPTSRLDLTVSPTRCALAWRF
jgi:hypothetical protein